MLEDYKPRLTVELDEKLAKRFQDLVPWGLKKQLMLTLMTQALDLIEEGGQLAIAAIIQNKISLMDILRAAEVKPVTKGRKK